MSSSDFIGTVLSFAKEHQLWQTGDAILLAVSGGPDSLGLLLFFKEIAQKEGLRLGCCCVNHHLRDEAEEETAFVASVCQDLQIPFYRKDVFVKETREREKGSLETVARDLRYAALREVKEQENFRYIALAHHGDDQAETVVFHFLRGSGARGLSGMQPKRDDLLRPFLGVTKKDIQAFVDGYPYEACHDATNDIPNTTRNQIRLHLLPQLLSYNPNLVESLGHMADIFREEDSYMDGEAQAWLSQWAVTSQEGYLLIPRREIQKLPTALLRRVLRKAAFQVGKEELDFQSLERMRTLLQQGSGQRTSSHFVTLQVERVYVFLYPGNTKAGMLPSGIEMTELVTRQWLKNPILTQLTIDFINKNSIIIKKEPWQMVIQSLLTKPSQMEKNQYLLDGDQVGALHLVFPKKGDTMAPYGMEGTKEVLRILQEAAIPSPARPFWPLVADGSHIYWTGFLRGSRFGRPSSNTTHYLLITLSWIGKETKK